MRLIDKDNLRKASKGIFIYQDEFEDDVQHVAFEAYTKDDIEREPTVKAIPIEWFEWLLDTMGDGMYNLRAVIKDWERYKENWGKENDRNQT